MLPWVLRDHQDSVDAVIELTIVGIGRIAAMPEIKVPVYNMARAEVKTVSIYPEIAESCVRRIRDLLGAEKIIGRAVLVVGFGMAGRHVARILRATGCRVSVVDKRTIALIEAAENGFRTFRSVREAIDSIRPFLVIGCTGDIAFELGDFQALPEGAFVTGIATRDLLGLACCAQHYEVRSLPGVGSEYRSDCHSFVQLGDGRSVNLFLSQSIPNRCFDLFKAASLVAARDLCARCGELPGGIYLKEVDDAVASSGLLERYYDLYLRESFGGRRA